MGEGQEEGWRGGPRSPNRVARPFQPLFTLVAEVVGGAFAALLTSTVCRFAAEDQLGGASTVLKSHRRVPPASNVPRPPGPSWMRVAMRMGHHQGPACLEEGSDPALRWSGC